MARQNRGFVPPEREIIKGYDDWRFACARLEKAIIDLQDEVEALRHMHMEHRHEEHGDG